MAKINLVPGQYQFGDIVFGRGTLYRVANVQVQTNQTVPQDHTATRSNIVLFGQDALLPSPIVFEIIVLDNFPLGNVLDQVGGSFDASGYESLLDDLASEWRGDDVRTSWNAQKALRVCGRDGTTRVRFGRPRKFEHTWRQTNSIALMVTAEFMPSDTLSYSDDEYGLDLAIGETAAPSRLDGPATTWPRFVIEGPAQKPTINFGDIQIQLDYDVAAGEFVEINANSWQRRVINSVGINLAAKLKGPTRFLDRVQWPAKDTRNLSWTATGTNANSNLTIAWREAWPVIV